MYPGLRYAEKNKICMQKFFLESVCLSKTFDLRLKKMGYFNFTLKNFLLSPPEKNASHTNFVYGNCMITVFCKKKTSFFSSPDCFYLVQIAAETSSNLFSMIFLKLYENCKISISPYMECMKLYDKHFRSRELSDKHFRYMEV